MKVIIPDTFLSNFLSRIVPNDDLVLNIRRKQSFGSTGRVATRPHPQDKVARHSRQKANSMVNLERLVKEVDYSQEGMNVSAVGKIPALAGVVISRLEDSKVGTRGSVQWICLISHAGSTFSTWANSVSLLWAVKCSRYAYFGKNYVNFEEKNTQS